MPIDSSREGRWPESAAFTWGLWRTARLPGDGEPEEPSLQSTARMARAPDERLGELQRGAEPEDPRNLTLLGLRHQRRARGPPTTDVFCSQVIDCLM